MKRTLFTLAGSICASLTLAAQGNAIVDPESPDLTMGVQKAPMVSATDFFKNPDWIQAFAYTFTPISEVEPKVDAVTMDAIKDIQKLLSVESPDLEAVRKILLDQISSTGKDTNAVIHFTLGVIDQQLAGALKPDSAANKAAIGQYIDEAVDSYEKAIKKFPTYQRAHRNLGMIYMNREDKSDAAKALPHLEQAVILGARDAATYAMLGYCAYLEGNLYSAEAAFKNALMLDTTNKDVYQLLAQTLLQQTRYKEARAMFQELIAKDPNNVQWWMALVNTYLAENDLDHCITGLEVVRHMKNADAQSLYLLGNIYVMRSMFDLAADVYEQAVAEAKDTDSPQNAIEAAQSLAGYNALDQATVLLRKIQDKYGKNLTDEQTMSILTMKSKIEIAQGNGDDAAKTLSEILTRDPLNGLALNTLASYYSESVQVGTEKDGKPIMKPRDYEHAVLLLERAEKLNDSLIAAAAMRQHARLLIDRTDTESLRDAVDLLENSQGLDPQDNVAAYINEIRQAIAARSAR